MFCLTRNQHNYSNRKSHSLVELGDGHSPLFQQQKALLLQQYSRQQASPLVLDLVKHSPSQQQPQHPCFFRAGKKGQNQGQGQKEGREDDRRLDFIKVNSLAAATESRGKEQGLFKPKSFKSNSKVDENRFQSFLQTRLERRTPGRFSSERGQFSEAGSPVPLGNDFRKSSSIMVIRKLNKKKEMKEELAQKEKDKTEKDKKDKEKTRKEKEKGGGKGEGEGLLKRQEIPIHHSQFYFSRRKTRTDASLDHLDHLNTRTFTIINQLSKLRQSGQHEDSFNSEGGMEGGSGLLSEVRGQTMEKHRDRISRKEMLKVVCIGKTKQLQNRAEEIEFGPWKRNLTGDFDGFI